MTFLSRSLAVAAVLGLAPPLLADEHAAAPYSAETVIARVGETEITLGHVTLMVAQLPEQYQQLPDEALFRGIVDQLIDQELLAQELAAAGDIPAGVAVMLENEQRALYAREIIGSILSAEPDEAEVRAAYEAEIGALPTELEYSAAHILVETEEEASAILADLEAGADFAETAAEKSTGPSGPNGGDLGWFGAGAMVPAFDQAVQGMEPGALAGPVQTQFGWHVIKLNDTREKPKPTFEETRADFARQVRQGRLEAHIAGLRDSTAFEDLSSDVPATAIRDSASLP